MVNNKEFTPGKKALFGILAFLIVLVPLAIAVEVAAYVLIEVKGVNFYLPLDLNDRANIPKPQPPSTEYYYELGWEPAYPNAHGYRGEATSVDDAMVAVFGDSFTKAHPDIERSWPYLLEKKLDRPVLNFGVSGYGTDQAYLRFRKRYVRVLDTPYVGLFVMSENIARMVNRYRGFYKRLRQTRPTKPRFLLKEDGEVAYLPNPLSGPEELERLWDKDFLERIGENDYWYAYFDRYGLNKYVGFPYSYYLVKAAPYYIQRAYRSRFQNRRIYEDLYSNEEATAILRFVIDRFIYDAQTNGAVPIVVFLPNWKDLTDLAASESMIYSKFLTDIRAGRQSQVYDAADYFKLHMDRGKPMSSFFISRSDGHYGPAGEEVVAEAVFDILDKLESGSPQRQ